MKLNKLFNKNSITNLFTLLLLISVSFSETFVLDTSLLYLFLIFFFLILNLQKLKLNSLQIFSILVLIIYLSLITTLASSPISLLNNYKYFFSFILFIFFFKIYTIDNDFLKNFKIILIACVIFVFIDAFIINYLPKLELHQEVHTAKFFGFYKRPPGFAGNSTTSSIFILFSYLILKKIYHVKFNIFEQIFIYTSVILLFSSTGFFFMFITIFLVNYEHKRISSYAIILFSFLFLFIFYIFAMQVDSEFAQKLSIDYFNHVFLEKLFYIKLMFFNYDLGVLSHDDLYFIEKFLSIFMQYKDCSTLYGCQLYSYQSNTSGDAGLLGVVEVLGYFGAFCLVLIFLSFSEYLKNNLIYLLLIIFISLHYGFVFSNVGNLILGIILTKNLNRDQVN